MQPDAAQRVGLIRTLELDPGAVAQPDHQHGLVDLEDPLARDRVDELLPHDAARHPVGRRDIPDELLGAPAHLDDRRLGRLGLSPTTAGDDDLEAIIGLEDLFLTPVQLHAGVSHRPHPRGRRSSPAARRRPYRPHPACCAGRRCPGRSDPRFRAWAAPARRSRHWR